MVSTNVDKAIRPVSRAVVSVTDKTGIVDLCQRLNNNSRIQQIEFLSTGGTYKELIQHGIGVKEVSEITKFPEILGGRVKTLHPKIHAGLLSIRGNETHEKSMKELELPYIDMVIINLYQFEKYAMRQQENLTPETEMTIIEQIDIGGPSMIRSAAKNFHDVVVISSVDQYAKLIDELETYNGCTTLEFRRQLAIEAFTRTSQYDSIITQYMIQQSSLNEDHNNGDNHQSPPAEFIEWRSKFLQKPVECLYQLKYGLNPHQIPSCLCLPPSSLSMPFTIINGKPGFVNILDAISAWQLVTELSSYIEGSPPTAASFKHVSPAGVAIGKSGITQEEGIQYDLPESTRLRLCNQSVNSINSCVAAALIRARNCDPLCSFGDFIGVSGIVDEASALYLKSEISDGIIAAGYTPEALSILSQKKSHTYVILQGDPNYHPPLMEYRESFGIGLLQRRNDVDPLGQFKIIAENKLMNTPSLAVEQDLRVAAVTLKYTQSNSVCFAQDGQAVGVAAGQQSRIDAVKLAAKKTLLWQLRRHPKVLNLLFKSGLKKQERVNGRMLYVNGCINRMDYGSSEWNQYFDNLPDLLTMEEVDQWVESMSKNISHIPSSVLCAVSDGFFPFRDSIDVMAKNHVQWIMHPGGSIADSTIVNAAESFKIGLIESNVRLFTH